MSFGLALAGGGCRGAAHVGVLRALLEENLVPTCVSGASAGAIVAGLYACGYTPAQLTDVIVRIARQKIRILDPDLPGILRAVSEIFRARPVTLGGILRGDKLLYLLDDLTDGRMMAQADLPLFIPCVDLSTGYALIFHSTPRPLHLSPKIRQMRDVSVADAMGASSAVPAVFAPMRLPEAGCLVDGGVANILPVDLLLAYGERNVVAIDIGEPYSPPMCQSLFEIASHSLSVMSEHLKECTVRGERLLIRPKLPDEAGLFTFDLMEECLEAGYRAARELIDVIRALA